MAFHPEAFEPIVILIAVAVAVVLFYYLVRWIRHTLGHLGLSPGEIAVIIWATLVGALINIPIVPFGEGWVGINVGGAVVPVVLSAYLIRRKGLPVNEVLVGVTFVTIAAYAVTRYEPGVGVIAEFPWWLLPPFAAFLVAAFAYWHERPHSAALAYVSGTLGTLFGADILRLPEIFSGPAPTEPVVMSLGGAGVFDMVFLTGILAVTMEAGLLAKTRERIVSQSRHDPIDAEYQAWMDRKEKESNELREKTRQTRRQPKRDDRNYAKLQLEKQTTSTRPAHATTGSTPGGPTTQPSTQKGATSRTRSQYQPRTTSSYQSRYHKRGTFTSRYRDQRTRPTKYRETQEKPGPEKSREKPGTRARPEREKAQDEEDRDPRAGPRPPPRQPRPASGTKRIPASHRARGLYR